MNKIWKAPAGLDCPIVLSEDFVAVDDDNVCTAPINADKDILELVHSSKNIIDADSDDENKMNNAAFVPKLSEMRNKMSQRRRLPNSLRWRAVGWMEMGLSQADVARRLNVSRSVVQRLWDQYQSEDSVS
ncbi:paired domain-containing protein [Trichonephila clavipes]|nr:paired domain-containing protein [Trichonephila clavipes]